MTIESQTSAWMSYALGAASVFSGAWGLLSIADPTLVLRSLGMPEPSYPEFLQCIGMICVVCGIGFGIAALNPLRHWPIVLVGFLLKVSAPVGFAWSAARGHMPWRFGWTMLATDLIWTVPFALILLAAYRAHAASIRLCAPEIQRMALRARTQYGKTLLDMSAQSPLMLVFLRQAGCTFCREAVSDISAKLTEIRAAGTQIVLVHMGEEQESAPFFTKYGLSALPRVSDPQRRLYRAFGLRSGSILNLFGPKVWWRSIEAGVLAGHGIGWPVADAAQMPGVFVIFHGEILRGYQHRSAADRPNYLELAVFS